MFTIATFVIYLFCHVGLLWIAIFAEYIILFIRINHAPLHLPLF